ncbi:MULTISPECIES: hypothetical protein [unclassified Photobacterium]|uniref:hypothetical protein n=2 Tax=Photobacterium TaxID=657 RepID=UPI000D1534F8|nr:MULTISPECIES: hypothetical protein [unclassified Photobacterium]PSV20703.1 hypothetical protein C9J42_21110 [Photobacterium sp. GB-56]PSV31146.1 hypothetical protein C9J38_21355 [Photobacterium sp. GB-210]PSV36974.1 hypothetical protein C9J46_21065 [Photobacterium sp. GB-36]PSW68720.1 hypothetical protein C9J41_21495 [Photobacterium sp. GB-50]
MKVTISTLLLVFSFLALTGCSKATTPQQADIAVFEQFLSENPISSISSSIDVASIYMPGDPLFEGVLNIQRNLWGKAEKALKPLVDKNDPDALYWTALISYSGSIKSTPIARKMLIQSAELGNPYAALFFAPDNHQCQMYFPNDCSEKWVEKAQKLFAEKAKTGDVRAVYYSTTLKPDLTHKEYIDAVIQSAEKHYYYPLVEYANKIINEDKPNKNMEAMAVNLLNYARFNNFVPAIEGLIGNEVQSGREGGESYLNYIEQGIKLGSNAAWNLYQLNSLDNNSLNNTQKYIVAKALDLQNGRSFGLHEVIAPKEKDALIAANKKAQEKADSVKKVIYIDGAHATMFYSRLDIQ